MTAVTQARPTASAGSEARVPGDVNMWIFVLGDLVFFAGYFVIFMLYREHERALFAQSQRHLSLTIGTVNTVLLLTGSWFAALAVDAARTNADRRASRLLVGAIGCGAGFLALKGYEWATLTGHGFTLPRNEFFMFYFMLTGVHLLHVLFGLLVLGYVRRELRPRRRTRVWVVETGATYWHMVDLLWVVIFALLYVLR